MATISENLQIIKNSTDSIKQAIIDKGGEISGDISTWANAISAIESAGSGSEPIKFYCTASIDSSGTATYTGYFENADFLESFGGNARLFIVYHSSVSIVGSSFVSSHNYSSITFTVNNVKDSNTDEPISSSYLYNLTAMIGPGYEFSTKYIGLPVELVEILSTDPA